MNGFAQVLFWQLWGAGLIGTLLWIVLSRLNPKDLLVTGAPADILRAHWPNIALAGISHLILSVALWEGMDFLHVPPVRNVLAYIASGYGSQSVVPKLLGMALGRLRAAAGDEGKDKP